jgi:hypothetical protein
MKKVVRLTESDLVRLVKKVIKEQVDSFKIARKMLDGEGIDSSDMDDLEVFQELKGLFHRADWDKKDKIYRLIMDIENDTKSLSTDEFIKKHQKTFKRRGFDMKPKSDSFLDMMDEI